MIEKLRGSKKAEASVPRRQLNLDPVIVEPRETVVVLIKSPTGAHALLTLLVIEASSDYRPYFVAKPVIAGRGGQRRWYDHWY